MLQYKDFFLFIWDDAGPDELQRFLIDIIHRQYAMDMFKTFQPYSINISNPCSGHILLVENVKKKKSELGSFMLILQCWKVSNISVPYWQMNIVNYKSTYFDQSSIPQRGYMYLKTRKKSSKFGSFSQKLLV